MEFDRTTTVGAFVVLLAVLVGGTLTSGMPTPIAIPVSVGLVVFSAIFLLLGVKHGEYRATR